MTHAVGTLVQSAAQIRPDRAPLLAERARAACATALMNQIGTARPRPAGLRLRGCGFLVGSSWVL